MASCKSEQTHSDVVCIDVVWTRNFWICFPDFNASRVNWKKNTRDKLKSFPRSDMMLFSCQRVDCELLKQKSARSAEAAALSVVYLCHSFHRKLERQETAGCCETLTGEDILVSVFTLVFWLLAFFPGIQQFALLLLKYLIVEDMSKWEKF